MRTPLRVRRQNVRLTCEAICRGQQRINLAGRRALSAYSEVWLVGTFGFAPIIKKQNSVPDGRLWVRTFCLCLKLDLLIVFRLLRLFIVCFDWNSCQEFYSANFAVPEARAHHA